MSFKDIPFGSKDKFNVVVEISKGSPNKYEYSEELDNLILDWVFTDGFSFPFNYGYIPQTRGGDGDALDVFIVGDQPLDPGVIVECKAVGMIELLDRGEQDDKIIAVALADSTYSKYEELEELSLDYKKVFEDFFAGLGVQKSKTLEIKGFHGSARATKEIELGYGRNKKAV